MNPSSVPLIARLLILFSGPVILGCVAEPVGLDEPSWSSLRPRTT